VPRGRDGADDLNLLAHHSIELVLFPTRVDQSAPGGVHGVAPSHHQAMASSVRHLVYPSVHGLVKCAARVVSVSHHHDG
jgi:hypothetical protein